MNKKGTDITYAANQLKGGGLVAIPTETVYGLAANALNEKSVLKIFEAKKRPAFDPLITHFSQWDRVMPYVGKIPIKAHLLAEAFTPGPITFILPKNDLIPSLVTSGHDTVGVRIPRHPMTRELLDAIDFPLAAPSANPFGYISPTTADHVLDQLGDEVDYVLDGGPCDVGIESTIIAFENQQPVILRLGGLALEQIEEVLGEKVSAIRTSSSNPNAPGMLSSHYSPRKKLIVGDIRTLLPEYSGQKVAIIQLQKEIVAHNGKLLMYELSEKGDLEEAARRIFDVMRAADQSNASVILAEYMPDTFLGRAINDRLRRANNA